MEYCKVIILQLKSNVLINFKNQDFVGREEDAITAAGAGQCCLPFWLTPCSASCAFPESSIHSLGTSWAVLSPRLEHQAFLKFYI